MRLVSAVVALAACSVPETTYYELPRQKTYLKAASVSNTGNQSDEFGASIALSADGTTLAVGAPGEDGGADHINGPYNDEVREAGAVYVYVRTAGRWTQQAYIKPQNPGPDDSFGFAVALSADGSTLVVGAPNEDSSARSVNGIAVDDLVVDSGAAYIFERTSDVWRQTAYLKTSNSDHDDFVGTSVSVSGDGMLVAVGVPQEDSGAIGVNGDQADNSMLASGAAFVFQRVGAAWVQQAYIKSFHVDPYTLFGDAVALSGDGSVLAVAAPAQNSGGRGIDPTFDDQGALSSGAAYVYRRTGSSWQPQTYLKASNADPSDRFGSAIALSMDGTTLAVHAANESSTASTIDGDQTNNTLEAAGAVYVFTSTGATWQQQAYVKPPNPDKDDIFGISLSLSGDGSRLLVGSFSEDSATGSDPYDNSVSKAGAAYLFERAPAWQLSEYIKASLVFEDDSFGYCVALAADGATIAIGARNDDATSQGVDADPTQRADIAFDSGAAYIFR